MPVPSLSNMQEASDKTSDVLGPYKSANPSAPHFAHADRCGDPPKRSGVVGGRRFRPSILAYRDGRPHVSHITCHVRRKWRRDSGGQRKTSSFGTAPKKLLCMWLNLPHFPVDSRCESCRLCRARQNLVDFQHQRRQARSRRTGFFFFLLAARK